MSHGIQELATQVTQEHDSKRHVTQEHDMPERKM